MAWKGDETWKSRFPPIRVHSRLGLLLGILALFFLLWETVPLALAAWSQHRLHRAVTALREAGYPVSRAELSVPPLPPPRNAAPLYLQAGPGLRRLQRELRGIDWEQGLPPARLAGLGRPLARHRTTLALLRTASHRPRCRFPVDWRRWDSYRPLPHHELMDYASHALVASALYQAHQGSRAGAYRDLAAALRLAWHMSQEVPFASQRRAYICYQHAASGLRQAIAWLPPTPAQVAALLPLLRDPGLRPHYALALSWERAQVLTEIEEIKGHASLLVGLLNMDALCYLQAAEQIQAIAQDSSIPGSQAVRRVARVHAAVPSHALHATIWTTTYDFMFADLEEARTRLAQARWALALALYRQRAGRYPPRLQQAALPPVRLGADPFTGRPLRYRLQGRGYLLYSCGENGRDDRGRNWRQLKHRPAALAEELDDLPWSCSH